MYGLVSCATTYITRRGAKGGVAFRLLRSYSRPIPRASGGRKQDIAIRYGAIPQRAGATFDYQPVGGVPRELGDTAVCLPQMGQGAIVEFMSQARPNT